MFKLFPFDCNYFIADSVYFFFSDTHIYSPAQHLWRSTTKGGISSEKTNKWNILLLSLFLIVKLYCHSASSVQMETSQVVKRNFCQSRLPPDLHQDSWHHSRQAKGQRWAASLSHQNVNSARHFGLSGTRRLIANKPNGFLILSWLLWWGNTTILGLRLTKSHKIQHQRFIPGYKYTTCSLQRCEKSSTLSDFWYQVLTELFITSSLIMQ